MSNMIDSPISITFHEDYRYPFSTWAVGTRVDGEKRYAVMTCMPCRKPDSGSPADFTEYDDAATAATTGLTALLMAGTREALAQFMSIGDMKWIDADPFEIGASASTPIEIRWPEILAIVPRDGAKA